MKFYLLTTHLFTVSLFINVQKELQITYSVKNSEIVSGVMNEVELRTNKLNTLYTESLTYSMPSKEGRYTVNEIVNQTYKIHPNNTMLALEDCKKVVKEEMNLFKWKFSEETCKVLNYSCKKATSEFRGRNYEAWFTTELPFRAAPWKVHGLPGVVLKLSVGNDYYLLEAVNLKVVNSTDEIKNPFNEKNTLSWNEYVIAYKKDIKLKEKYSKAEALQTGRNCDYSYPKIEIVVDENRESYDSMAKRIGAIY